jgi:hypothetical protein
LAVQFWDLYCICQEKTRTIAQVWVDGELRLTFRRVFSDEMMRLWDDLMSVVEGLKCYGSTGTYSSQFLYAIINYRGITPMYIPALWSVPVPPKIQFFLWLLSHNKLATVDNLNKKGMKKPEKCVFCEENESISHLFFECSVGKFIWKTVSEFLGMEVGADYTSIASKWLSKKNFAVVNVISTAVLRAVWLIRNDFVFNHQAWSDVKLIWNRIWRLSMDGRLSVQMRRWKR